MSRREPTMRLQRRFGPSILAFFGFLLLQTAWILTIPPFSGLDEHDHAFKAAAVARGDWSPTHEASPLRWGQFVEVPTTLVRAAQPICDDLVYTTTDNCVGHPAEKPGTTRVASSAATYNPAFYSLMGSAALPFQGVAALYAMRIAAAVVCAVLLTLGVACLRSWSQSHWPGVTLLLAATPMLLYTVSMAAPNGVETAAAVLLWCALLGVIRRRARGIGALVASALVAAIPLAVVRGMGPIWLLLTALTVAILLDREAAKRLFRHRGVQIAALLTVSATVYSCWWILASGSTDTGAPRAIFRDSPWASLPGQWVLWFFQAMAAFPARDEIAPIAVYVIGFIAWWVFVALTWRFTVARERIALLTILAWSTAIPAAITVLTYRELGTAWQGRYSYPYAIGFLLLCGFALDRAARKKWAEARWPVWLAAFALLAMELIGQVDVLARESRTSPLANTTAWVQPSVLVLVVLNLTGIGLLAWSLTMRGRAGDFRSHNGASRAHKGDWQQNPSFAQSPDPIR